MTRSIVGVLTRVAMIYVNLDPRDERPQLPRCIFALCVKRLEDLRCRIVCVLLRWRITHRGRCILCTRPRLNASARGRPIAATSSESRSRSPPCSIVSKGGQLPTPRRSTLWRPHLGNRHPGDRDAVRREPDPNRRRPRLSRSLPQVVLSPGRLQPRRRGAGRRATPPRSASSALPVYFRADCSH